MFTAFLCLVALGVIAGSAIYSARAMRRMDIAYADRVHQD